MKLKLVGITILVLMTFTPFILGQTNFVKAPNLIVNENAPRVVNNQNPINYPDWVAPISFNVNTIGITISELDTNARTLYTLQSNCSPQQIMESGTAGHLHAIFMNAKDVAWNTRNVPYFFSSNGGTNWSFLGYVTGSSRSGYGNLMLMNDGRAVVGTHTGDGGGDVRSQLYIDLLEGTGSWTRMDPGDLPGGSSAQHVWPRGVSTNNDQVVFYSSINASFPGDSVFRNRTTNISTGTFSGFVWDPNGQNAEDYSLARSGSKVCLAFPTGQHNTSHGVGSAAYMESTDNGVTWGAPVIIREAIYTPGHDSLGVLRGINVVYYNNAPAIVFGLAPQDPSAGGFYPNAFASIYFWSQAAGLVRLDSLPYTTCSNNTVNDVLVAVCRASIGVSSNGTAIYTTWMHARADSSRLGAPYFDVYFSYSTNGGSSWATNIQVTNTSGPLKDNRWPSVSKSNSGSNAYIVFQQCDTAGSSVNGGPTQWGKLMFAKITDIPIGVKTIGNEVPMVYSLSQNYPNPFNPSTIIRFALPKNDNVTLKLYDVTGKLVATLLNNEAITAGIHEVDFNSSSLASGVYFYTINSGKFTDTKKMVLVK